MHVWDTLDLERAGPKYLMLYGHIAQAIADGRLRPGRRLPSHRFLADRLGVSVGTVTRAYAKALDDGLVAGHAGRGTFVREHRPVPLAVVNSSRIPAGSIDLFQNFPVPVPEVEDLAWADTLADLGRQGDLASLMRLSWSEMAERDQQAGAAWIGRLGLDAPPRRILNCPGVQSALCAIVAAATEPGDLIATAALSHQGVKLLGEQYGLKVRGLELDDDGIDPQAFEELCRETPPRLLYLAPTIHSPTTITMPPERRQAIAAVARRYDVWIIEDESAAFLLPEPPLPVAALAPERTFFLGDVWLALALGLRTTYVLVPEPLLGVVDRTVAATSGLTPVLVAEVAARWIGSDIADRLIEARREAIEVRREMASSILSRWRLHAAPYGHHVWLELPPWWTADRFTLAAERSGVAVNSAEWFWIEHGPAPDAVRICIGNAPGLAQLRWALEQLDRLLEEPRAVGQPAL